MTASARTVLLVALLCAVGHSFLAPNLPRKSIVNLFATKSNTNCPDHAADCDNVQLLSSRRSFGAQLIQFVGAVSPFSLFAAPAAQAKISEEEEAKRKILEGYELLCYFIDHWVEETTICGRSGDNPYISPGGCERTPIKVMEYLGFKDTSHPLYRADKTMRRLEALVPPEREVDYLEAIEKFAEAADEGSGMAFVSSWGEANPGGGKDRVELFIERAKKNVIDSRDSLSSVIEILDLKTL